MLSIVSQSWPKPFRAVSNRLKPSRLRAGSEPAWAITSNERTNEWEMVLSTSWGSVSNTSLTEQTALVTSMLGRSPSSGLSFARRTLRVWAGPPIAIMKGHGFGATARLCSKTCANTSFWLVFDMVKTTVRILARRQGAKVTMQFEPNVVCCLSPALPLMILDIAFVVYSIHVGFGNVANLKQNLAKTTE